MAEQEKDIPRISSEEMDGNIEKGLRATAIRQVVLFVVGTAGVLTYTRDLGPEGMGLFGIALFVYSLLTAVAQAPFRDAVIYYRDEAYAHATFICLVIFGVIASVIAYATAPLVGAFYDSAASIPLIRAICVAFFLYSLAVVPSALLLKRFRYGFHELLQAASEVIFAVVVMFFVWWGWGIWALLTAYIVQGGFWAATTWWAAGYRPKWVGDWEIYRKVLRFSGNLLGSELLGYVNGNADNAAVGRLGEKALGYYTFGEGQSAFIVLGVGLPISQITLPALAAVRDQPKAFRTVFSDMVRLISFVGTPAHVGAFLLADYIVVLFFGVEWLPAVSVIRAYFAFRLFNTILAIANVAASAYGRPDIRLKQGLVELVLFVIGIWIGMTVWGTVEGIAWVLVVVRIFMAFFYYSWVVLATPMTFEDSWAALWPSFAAAAALGAVVWGMRLVNPFGFVEPTGSMSALWPIAAYVPVGVIVFGGLYYVLDRAGFESILGLVRRVIWPTGQVAQENHG